MDELCNQPLQKDSNREFDSINTFCRNLDSSHIDSDEKNIKNMDELLIKLTGLESTFAIIQHNSGNINI
ncbi:hypothetical protein RRG08_035421 [Elysia crispata]|uniref:Uncharacterized protein n=1 Tax=Elysia crispata TaxID=231223 RepID=A0AAE1CS28_9GAST|nr:hypothetical protein RRG08_035421 [Elysia crispata]